MEVTYLGKLVLGDQNTEQDWDPKKAPRNLQHTRHSHEKDNSKQQSRERSEVQACNRSNE